jgi:hypothetical protein
VLVLAATVEQARVVFNYVAAFLAASEVLRKEIASTTRAEIRLKNGIVIAIHPNSFRSVRGRTLVACIFDELAYWRDDSTATPDSEVYTAVLPALLTTNGMLVGISSPYRRVGLLHAKHKQYFGVDNDDTLVVQGPTVTFMHAQSRCDRCADGGRSGGGAQRVGRAVPRRHRVVPGRRADRRRHRPRPTL